MASVSVELSADEVLEITSAADQLEVAGARYTEAIEKTTGL